MNNNLIEVHFIEGCMTGIRKMFPKEEMQLCGRYYQVWKPLMYTLYVVDKGQPGEMHTARCEKEEYRFIFIPQTKYGQERAVAILV